MTSLSLRYGSPYRRAAPRRRANRMLRTAPLSSSSFAIPSLPSFKLPKLPTFSEAVKSVKFSFSLGPTLVIVSTVIVVSILTFISLMFGSREVTKGYVLRDLESKRQTLMRESEVKLMQVAKAQALNAVLTSNRVDRMIPARNIEFMRGDTALASIR